MMKRKKKLKRKRGVLMTAVSLDYKLQATRAFNSVQEITFHWLLFVFI